MKTIEVHCENSASKEIRSGDNSNCSKYSIVNEENIEIYKGARSFGLLLIGGANDQQSPGDSSIYVSKVLEGGLAELDGRIHPGDRITAVKQYLDDGDAYTFDFDNDGITTKEEAKHILRKCKGRIALFIVSKNEKTENKNKTAKNLSMDPIVKSVNKTNLIDNNPADQTKETSEPDHKICNENNLKLILPSQPPEASIELMLSSQPPEASSLSSSSASSSSGEVLSRVDQSRVRLINVSPSIRSRSWPPLGAQRSNSCSVDYRAMAKYGIRPSSSLMYSDAIQPIYHEMMGHHRIKKKWISGKLSSLSIQEDDEEELYPAPLPQVQRRFELEIEQRVL